jgi:hypothetical protein
MRHLNEYIPLFLTSLVTIATIVYSFYSILLWRATRAAAEISRQAALSNLWTELNRYIEFLRNESAADAGFMEKLSNLILEFMISNLLNESALKNKETLEEFRRKVVALAEQNRDVAARYSWVARLVESRRTF